MPQQDTTRGNAGSKPPKKRKRYAPPPSRSDAAQRTGARSAPPPPKPKADPNQGRSDAASGGRNQIKRANRFKATSPKYRKAVEAAYDATGPGQSKHDRNTEKHELLETAKGREGRIIRQLHALRARRAAASGAHDITSDADRATAEIFKHGKSYAAALAASRKARQDRERPPEADDGGGLGQTIGRAIAGPAGHVANLADLGFKDTAPAKIVSLPAGVAESGVAIAEAAYHDPIGVPFKTAKQTAYSLAAAPGGAVEAVRNPIKTGKEVVSGAVERSSKPYSERVKDIRDEGALDYASDIALVAAPASGGVRAAARKAGMTKPAAATRVSGNTVVPSKGEAGPIKTAAQKRAGRKLEERLQEAEAGGRPVSALEYQAAQANREASHVVELPAKREQAQFRNPARRQVAKARGRAVYAMRADQSRRVKDAQKRIDRLNAKEKRAFYYAAAMGIRTAEQARALLGGEHGLAAAIKAKRAAAGVQPVGALRKTDMLPEIAKILVDPEAHFTTRLAATVDALEPDSRRAGREDPRLAEGQAETRRHADQAALLGLDASDLDTVRSVADDLGLAEPQYFRSSRYADERGYGAYAVGGGHGAMRADRQHEGRNLEAGLQDTRPEMFTQGLARNIKAKHNWGMVADIVEANAIRELSPPEGATIAQLRARVAEAGIDPESVAFFDAGAFRAAAQHSSDRTTDDRFEGAEDFEGDQIADALDDAMLLPGAAVAPDVLQATRRWVAVPTAVLRELKAETAPSGFAGRAWDVGKGKTSRAMLLTSPPWLLVNVASNALLSGLGTAGRAWNPKNLIDAQRWWKSLDDAERDRVGAILGLDSTSADSHQVRLGSTANSDFINSYRALKAHPFWSTGIIKGRGPSLRDFNLMEAMAKLDRAQNNTARKAAAYALMKRDAFRDMAKSMGRADRAQAKLMNIFRMPPAERLHAMAQNRELLEQHADHIADYLGDYTTYTAAERKVIGRTAMFYGWMRHSLKLVFVTLPTQHPAMTAVLAQLGNLRVDELRELLGEDGLPYGLGKITFGSNGNVKSIDLAKLNPSGNALLDAVKSQNPRALLGTLPPIVSITADQLTHSSGFRDAAGSAEWRVAGKAGKYGAKPTDYGASIRGRILLDDIASLTFPYRTAEKLTQTGGQGDDSLLGSERPTVYTGTDAADKLRRKFAELNNREMDAEESLLAELVPFLPESSDDAKRARQSAALERVAKRGKKDKPKFYGAKPAATTTKKYFGSDATPGGKPDFYGAKP